LKDCVCIKFEHIATKNINEKYTTK